jgi:spermidine/putrescine transport system substrate-binding protein
MANFSRRDTLRMLTAAMAASAATAMPARAAGGKITVLNWKGYGTDEDWSLKAFTAATGIEVVHDYFSSESWCC